MTATDRQDNISRLTQIQQDHVAERDLLQISAGPQSHVNILSDGQPEFD
jgi:hypothetical protein